MRQDWGITDASLVQRYKDGETIYELAESLGRSVMGVYKKLKKAGVTEFRKNRTPPDSRGAKSGRWKGGVSLGYQRARHGNWNQQRALALERDEHACQDCGATEKLCVHHQGDPANHSLENLRTLCSSCHIRLHRLHEARWGTKER